MYTFSQHQKKQVEVINETEKQILNNRVQFSTVPIVEDYENDTRLCLTGIHLPSEEFANHIQSKFISPLQKVSPEHYYYHPNSLHLSIKSVRVINDPPHFNNEDIEKAKAVFADVIPKHRQFSVYFYRLLLFPNNLAIMGTTDPELDSIHLDIDEQLKNAGVPDDKEYTNKKYFFSNMTLIRFRSPLSKEFIRTVDEMSQKVDMDPYTIDSVTLLVCNAVLKKQNLIGSWKLLPS